MKQTDELIKTRLERREKETALQVEENNDKVLKAEHTFREEPDMMTETE